MASTRNNNTPGNYNLEQTKYYSTRNYETFVNSQYGMAYNPALPTFGINPTHMPRETFSANSVDVESALFGINSTNLVSPQKPVNPELKTIPTISFFERLPLLMPNPLVIENKQRPYFLQ
jgi:hypothetical protein